MISIIIVLLSVIIIVAFMTIAERKIMAGMQRRIGPNNVGYLGLLQPFADGLKLILKETVLPLESSHFLFLGAPFISFYLALLNLLVLPFGYGLAISEYLGAGLLIIICISELSIYCVLYSGWSANSKYPFLGGLRSTAQMISYSVSLSLIYLTVIFTFGSLNLLDIIHYSTVFPLFIPLFPLAILFIISAVAETNRAPFDLPEAESELVAGFFTEHSAVSFAYFFLGEYTNILVISYLFFILFLGISNGVFLVFFMIWIRATFARLRFDSLIYLGWAYFLPFTISVIKFLPCLLFTFNLSNGI